MEQALKKRPMTRAWAALVASAENDAAKAEELRQESDRYLRESDALAQRRIVRRKATTAQLTPKGSTWDPDWSSESELQRFGEGEGLGHAVDVMKFKEEVVTLRKMLQAKTEWKVKLAAFSRFEVMSGRVVVRDGGFDDALEEIVELMAAEVVGLRGTLVKKAAEAIASGAALFSMDQTVTLVDTALTARIKTKKVMADAADHLARTLLQQATSMTVWEFVAGQAQSASHPVQRKSCVDYVCEIGLRLDITGFDGIVQKVIASSMLDKSAMVRDAAKNLYGRYAEDHKSQAEKMFESFSMEVRSRLVPQNQTQVSSSLGIRKAKGRSMKDIIRERRRQMQATKAQTSKSGANSKDERKGQLRMQVAQDKENQTVATNVCAKAPLVDARQSPTIPCDAGNA